MSNGDLWASLFEVERRFVAARMEFLAQDDEAIVESLRVALTHPAQRGTALRTLQFVDVALRKQLFPILVELASSGHSDIQLVRDALMSLPRDWLETQLWDAIIPILDRPVEPWEEYRRFAELLHEMDSHLLDDLVALALKHPDPDVREVGTDFTR